jgi:hypothetical protein
MKNIYKYLICFFIIFAISNCNSIYAENNLKINTNKILNISNSNNFTLTINIIGEGIVQKIPDNDSYEPGSIVQLNATPSEFWIFEGWSGDLYGLENPNSIIMNSNKTVNVTFRFIPEILRVRIDVLPWNRLRIEIQPQEFEIKGWRGKEQEIRVTYNVTNSYNRIDNDVNIYLRLREWQLDSALQKILFIFSDSGNIWIPEENTEILSIKFTKFSIPLFEGNNTGEVLMKVNFFETNNCHLGGLVVCVDSRLPYFWNYDWTGNDIYF